MAPRPEAAPEPHQEESRPLPAMRDNLGTLNLGAYLDAYGIPYHIKELTGKTLYILDNGCLFDSSHTKGEAGIMQSINAPYLTYQCFHDSCKGSKRWQDARQAISGEDKIVKFYSNYDPDYHKKRRAEERKKVTAGQEEKRPLEPATLKTFQYRPGFEVVDFPLPPPGVVDPMMFFDESGKRPVFAPRLLAEYLAMYLHPIVYTKGVWWRYEGGVWKEFPKTSMKSAIIYAMGQQYKLNQIEATLQGLQGLVNREEHQWPETYKGYVNMLDGMLDLNTQKMFPHDPKYGSRSQIPCHYGWEHYSNPNMARWFRFLDEIFPEKDTTKKDIIQEFFGYCLLPDCRYQKCLFLYGGGANGKTVLEDVLVSMLGKDNTSTLSFHDLNERFRSFYLEGKMINVSTETDTREPAATEIFKKAVSGDWVTAERKHGEVYKFRNYAKFVFSMNELLIVSDRSPGFERRPIIIKFNRRFKPEEQEVGLSEELQALNDGIFMWSLMGLERLINQGGFRLRGDVAADTSAFMTELNPFLVYVQERVNRGPEEMVVCTKLYKDYSQWCDSGHQRKLARTSFYRQVESYFPEVVRRKYGSGEDRDRHFMGIGLKDE